jgi:tRNA-dihydrouridine synthase B
VLDHTGADGVMIGRAAQGRPWIFREIDALPADRRDAPRRRGLDEIHSVLLGSRRGPLRVLRRSNAACAMARKHISWYTKGLARLGGFRTP